MGSHYGCRGGFAGGQVGLRQITKPQEVVDLAELKRHVNVTDDVDNEVLQSLLSAAHQHLDGPDGILNGRCLGSQQWELQLAGWPYLYAVILPLAPVISVDEVKYRGASGVDATVNPSDFTTLLNAVPAQVVPGAAGWPVAIYTGPSDPVVRVKFTAGYGLDTGSPPRTTVPQPLRVAVKMLAAHWYQNREAVSAAQMHEVPMTVRRLIMHYKMFQ